MEIGQDFHFKFYIFMKTPTINFLLIVLISNGKHTLAVTNLTINMIFYHRRFN